MWGATWTRWVGYRYLRSKKKSGFLSLITVLSVMGVALGVSVVIVVLSVMDGFEGELKKRLSATELHVEITPDSSESAQSQGMVSRDFLEQQPAWKAWVAQSPEIEWVSPILAVEAILRTGRKVAGVVVKGVDAERWEQLKKHWTDTAGPEKDAALTGVVLGKELAYNLGVIPGDRIHLVSPTETQGPMGSIPLMKKFVVEAIYHTGVQEQEMHTVFAKDRSVQSYLRRRDVVTQWEVKLKDFEQAPAVANRLRASLQGARIKDWIQLNAQLFASLRLERFAMFIVLAFIIVVASFNIVTTLTMMVLEKKKEVAILRTMGATRSEVGAIFLFEGLWIGAWGISAGLGLAWLVCAALRRYEFIQLPEIYYDRTLPVSFNGLYYAGVGTAAVLITLAACIYPSRRASALDPLEGIRQGT